MFAAAEEGDVDEGLRGLAGTGSVTRLPWGRRAALIRALRDRTLKDRCLAPDHFRPWAWDAGFEIARNAGLGADDVLVSFGQPMSDHLAGRRIARRTGARWIAHFSDPWVDSPFRNASRPVTALNRRQEVRTIEETDGLIFTSEETAELVLSNHSRNRNDRIAILPHAFDPALYPDSGARADSGPLLIRYVGNFYGHRGPAPLFRGLSLLLQDDPGAAKSIRIELVGSFESDPLNAPEASGLPAGLVRVRGSVDYVDSLRLMRESDLLLVIDAPGPSSPFLPSKLVEYLGARRPILVVSPPGPATRLAERVGGWTADPGKPAAIAAALSVAVRSASESRGRDWGADDVAATFEASRAAERLDDFIDSVRRDADTSR